MSGPPPPPPQPSGYPGAPGSSSPWQPPAAHHGMPPPPPPQGWNNLQGPAATAAAAPPQQSWPASGSPSPHGATYQPPPPVQQQFQPAGPPGQPMYQTGPPPTQPQQQLQQHYQHTPPPTQQQLYAQQHHQQFQPAASGPQPQIQPGYQQQPGPPPPSQQQIQLQQQQQQLQKQYPPLPGQQPQQQQQQYYQQQPPPPHPGQPQQQFAPPPPPPQQQQQQQQQYYQQQPPPQAAAPARYTDPAAGAQGAMMAPPPSQSDAYRMQQQQQQQQHDEQPRAHYVTLTRASSNSSRIMNHESIPRPDVALRLEAAASRPVAPPPPGLAHVQPASTDFVRLTTSVIPATPQLADKFALPLAYTVTPLARGPAVPCVNFADLPNGGCGIVRCRRCRAYVNPYSAFTDGGRRWQCSVCRGLNDVPQPYFCPVDGHRGLRQDVEQRPELCHAVCDFIAPSDYMVRAPQRPSYVFALDLSYSAAEAGMIDSMCLGIADALWKLRNAAEADGATEEEVERFESMQVGFVGFDAVIYLFTLRSDCSAAKMVVAPDLALDKPAINEKTGLQDNVELPVLLEDVLVGAKDSFDLILGLLEKLPGMFRTNANAESAFGPALQTAITILNPTGGKIITALAGCPSVGEGHLRAREDPKLFHQPKEHTMTHPASDWYKDRALACSHAHISVDLFVNASTAVDLATIVPIARYTGGHVYHATGTNRSVLHRDVERCVTRTLGFEAIFRIRNPPQLGTINFFGHFYVRGNDMLALPVADEDASYSIQYNLQTALSGTLYAQTALLYTNHSRERRIRVFTFPIESSQSLARVYNNANAEAMAAIMCKTAVDASLQNSFQACIATMNDRMIKTSRTFKAMISGASRAAQTLVLPHALRLLPAYLNGYQRTPATRFSSVLDTPPDSRVANMSIFAAAAVDDAVSAVTPSIFCLYRNRGDLSGLPRQEIVSIEAMKMDGIYLVDIPGALRCLWYGRGVDSAALQAFSIPAASVTGSPSQSPAKPDTLDAEADEKTSVEELVERFHELTAKLDRLSRGLPNVQLHYVAQGSTAAANAAATSGSFSSPTQLPTPAGTSGFKTPTSPSGGRTRIVTERTIMPRMLEEEAKEAVSYTSYLAFLQRRSNSAE